MEILLEKIRKELELGMNVTGETDVAFVAMWVSRRADGSFTSTLTTHYLEGESLSSDLLQAISRALVRLADNVFPSQKDFERLSSEIVAIDGKYYRVMSDEEHANFVWSLPED